MSVHSPMGPTVMPISGGLASPAGSSARRPGFQPSAQQALFLEALRGSTERHFLVEARAGSGKSTTCRQAAWQLDERGLRSVYACFNRQIASDFQADLPGSCRAATLHSLGFGMLRTALRHVAIEDDKMTRLAERLFPRPAEALLRRAATRLAGLCKNLLNPGSDPVELRQLAADLGIELPREGSASVLGAVPELLRLARTQTASVDFDDMIWLPVVLDLASAYPPDFLFVDEAQDLNPCQHELALRACQGGRMVVIGDRYQAIYAWRGADAESLPNLARRLQGRGDTLGVYPLTVTRRCPASHVELARKLVPDLEPLPGAAAGSIHDIDADAVADWARPGDMVLCRSNAPLVGLAYELLAQGIPAQVRGRDLGQGIGRLIDRLRPTDIPHLVRLVRDHHAEQAAAFSSLRDPGAALQALGDTCECLLTLCQGAGSLCELRERIGTLFSDRSETGAVALSTIHRAKGLERSRVLLIRPDLVPSPWAASPEAAAQERNLAYVAITRSTSELIFVGGRPNLLT